MPIPLVTVGIAFLAKWASFSVLKYLAMRTFMILVVMGLGPIVIFQGLGLMMKFLSGFGGDLITSLMAQADIQPQIVGLSGVAGYLGSLLKLKEGVSIYMSFLMLKFVWGLVPKFGVPTGLVR